MRAKVTAPRRGVVRRERTMLFVVATAALVVLATMAACSSNDDRAVASTVLAEEELSELAAQSADAVWRVETEGCGWLGTGSAFAIGSRHLVTNHHVIANDSSPTLRSRSGEVLAGRVIGALERPDIAVIEVDAELTTMIQWAPTEDLRELEPIVIMGYPIPELTFAMTTGEIVSFQPPDDREALFSNAPIDRGNSGGPALRRDGSVAGVVTQMRTNLVDGEVISVAFTTATARSAVEAFIREPNHNVESRCGQGPDYIPPAPDDFVIPPPEDVPPEPSQPAELPPSTSPTLPTTSSTQSSRPSSTPTTTSSTQSSRPSSTPTSPTTAVACPGGDVAVTIAASTATVVEDDPGWWHVVVTGEVHNLSPAEITLASIDLTIDGNPPGRTLGFPEVRTLAPERSTAWEGGQYVFSPERQPSAVTAVLEWAWAAPAFGVCDSDAVETRST